jgi:diadenosine tetraphosphate (Ap4A) HIT family hydrolase
VTGDVPSGAGTTPECPLCRKLLTVRELPPDEVVWQFPHGVAFLGPWQYYHGYCVLVSRLHATELSQLTAPDRRAFLDEMVLLARAIQECFTPDKLNYEMLGNQVPHLHWHLFPRWRSDPEAPQAVWLALARAEHSEEERRRLQTGPLSRAETAELLREKIQELVRGS